MNPYKENADYNGSPAQRLDALRSEAFKAGQKEILGWMESNCFHSNSTKYHKAATDGQVISLDNRTLIAKLEECK